MKIFTIQEMKSWRLSKDPCVFLPPNWKGSAIDFLSIDEVDIYYGLEVILRTQILDPVVLRKIVCAYIRQITVPNRPTVTIWDVLPSEAQHLVEVIERYNYRQATKEELRQAKAQANAILTHYRSANIHLSIMACLILASQFEGFAFATVDFLLDSITVAGGITDPYIALKAMKTIALTILKELERSEKDD